MKFYIFFQERFDPGKDQEAVEKLLTCTNDCFNIDEEINDY